MTFALAPDDGPPRLIRYVGPNVLKEFGLIATLNRDTNVLTVDKELYDTLTRSQQDRVIKTRDEYIEIEALPLLDAAE